MHFYAFLTFLVGIETCQLTCQKLVKNWSNDKKNLDKLKFVRLRTQTSHIDCLLTTLTTREILCVIQIFNFYSESTLHLVLRLRGGRRSYTAEENQLYMR